MSNRKPRPAVLRRRRLQVSRDAGALSFSAASRFWKVTAPAAAGGSAPGQRSRFPSRLKGGPAPACQPITLRPAFQGKYILIQALQALGETCERRRKADARVWGGEHDKACRLPAGEFADKRAVGVQHLREAAEFPAFQELHIADVGAIYAQAEPAGSTTPKGATMRRIFLSLSNDRMMSTVRNIFGRSSSFRS